MGGVGRGTMDLLTLGQTKIAKDSAKQQEAMLNSMRDQQLQQLNELKKQGPAPTMELPNEQESEAKRRKRLDALRAGLSSTIRSSSSGVSNLASVAKPTAKEKLGE